MTQITQKGLEKLSHHKQVLFACFCAEQVLDLVKEKYKPVCKSIIETAYLFLEGKATKEECEAAAHAAYAAYAEAAHEAAAYAYAASAAANKKQTLEEQWTFYDQLLNGDKYFEEMILKE
jgi:hypothetical protein